jgi:phosphatidylglycerol:prolipoprotein diacylglycerol transferase
MNTTAWVHNLNPFIIQFSENMGLRWYGMAYMAGFIVGALFMHFMAKRGRGSLPSSMVTDFITYVILGTMIGGRVGYAVFYSPDLLTDFSTTFPFWGLLKVWEGGMASHGGIIGVIIASYVFARRHKVDFFNLGDLVVLGGSLGIFFGRIANFINGELFGRPVEGTVPWAIKFPGEMHLWFKHDVEKPISSLEPDLLPKMSDAVQKLGVSAQDWMSWASQVRTSRVAYHEVQMTIDKVILAIQSGNEAVREALGPYLTARHPSQLYEALLEGLFLFIVTFVFWRKPRKPGLVGGLWLVLYAIVRIIGEQFRMPDAHIGFQLLGLTRGQWLSVGQLVVSTIFLVWIARRQVPAIAGWGPEAQALKEKQK